MADRVGQRFGDYRLTRLLRNGSFAEIYLGEHVSLDLQVVVKVLHLEVEPEQQARFLQEAQFLASLKHPHIVPMLEVGMDASTPYLVMAYVPNGTVRHRHPRGVALPPTLVLPYISHTAEALDFLHEQGIIHRNVKPGNLLLGSELEVLLGGFGIALMTPAPHKETTLQGVVGTPAYMAPEQLQDNLHRASDQYALGISVYEWLTGALPFGGGFVDVALKHFNAPPPPLREKAPDLSPAVEAVVLRALAKNPDERFPTVRAFAEAFGDACQTEGQTLVALPIHFAATTAGSQGLPPLMTGTPGDFLTRGGATSVTSTFSGIIIGVGQQLGNYRLVREIGRGAFATIYLGEHIHMQWRAAIKVLHGRMASGESEGFKVEARIIGNLDHPAIVQVLDFGEERGTAYLVMRYAPNGTLRERHPRGEKVPVGSVVQYVKQIAEALHFAHEQQVIHRDVKPENLLLGRHQEVLLGDFGIAVDTQSLSSHITLGVAGTAFYMAPEQIRGEPGPASDQYSLAVLVYEWLCGHPPFEGNFMQVTFQHLQAPPTPLRQEAPEVSPEVEAVVLKALAKDPLERFPTIRAFAQAFEQAVLPPNRLLPGRDLSGEQFGNYRLLRKIGVGHFADVYLGEQLTLQTAAAVKVVQTRLTDQEAEAFHQEAKVLLELKHPRIVQFYDFGTAGGIPYLVMQHAPNGSLRKRYFGQTLTAEEVAPILRQIAEALHYVHSRRLIHRDVKPENVLLDADQRLLLSDFGLATIAHSTRSQKTGEMAGTYAYMAPEQIKGKPRYTSDQYALGVMAYEWLAGERPFEGTAAEIIGQHLAIEPEPLHEKVATIPSEVEQVVLKALAKAPKDRFESVLAFAEAFEQACHPEKPA